jgi:hypothetical protein
MKPIFTILFATLCSGAVVSVCSTGCTTNSLQTALDTSANCGDSIQIKSSETQVGNFTITFRGCAANPITVTTDRTAWLPMAGARITPAHLTNMAKITTPNGNPALRDVLDGMGRPPAGWNFVGVAFTGTGGAGSFFLVNFNSNNAAGASQIADSITFDRCYFYMPSVYAGGNLQDVIRADATHLTVKDSFFGDAFFNGYVESHGIRALTNPGPVTVTNTFITTSGIPIFVGGATPSFPAYMDQGFTAQYNYMWRPWKWNGDPNQPYAADYVTAAAGTFRTGPHTITNVSNTGVVTIPTQPPFIPASVLTISGVGGCTQANGSGWRIDLLTSTTFQLRNFPGCSSAYTSGGTANEFAITVCTKNLGEFKWAGPVLWQYNAGENSWAGNQCQSQFNGFTNTFRTEWDWSVTTPALGVFTFTDTAHLSWSGTYRIGDISTGARANSTGDLGICITLPPTGTECHPIASFSAGSLVAAQPFSAAPAGPQIGWISYTASARLNNLVVRDNVYKNADQGLTVLACSFSNGMSCLHGHRILNNLWTITDPYVSGFTGFRIAVAETDYALNPSDYVFDHNTAYTPFGLAHGAFVYFDSNQCPNHCGTSGQPKLDSSAITNNLFGQSASGGNGPFSGDGAGSISDAANSYMANSVVRNNGLPGASAGPGCASGNLCSGNITAAWGDPFAGLAAGGIFKLAPASAYTGAGSDGRDVGADFDRLPQITGLKVTAGVTAALLEFDLTAAIGGADAAQPCILEVSPNRNLQSDLGTYTVVNDLNPVFFQRPDTSARTNSALLAVVVNGRHVYWPVGQNITVTGDDGAGHDLALAAGTMYYGRLMCNGDTQWFTFLTGSGSNDSVRYPLAAIVKTGTTPGTTGVRLQYGTNPALGSVAVFPLDGSGMASVGLPLMNGTPTYYSLQFLNGSTATYTSPLAVRLGGD